MIVGSSQHCNTLCLGLPNIQSIHQPKRTADYFFSLPPDKTDFTFFTYVVNCVSGLEYIKALVERCRDGDGYAMKWSGKFAESSSPLLDVNCQSKVTFLSK